MKMQDDVTERVILHLDLDCFYAQVEHERLGIPQDQPLGVQQWGSLIAINYPARPFGIKRSDNISDAKKKCPHIHLPHVETMGGDPNGPPDRSNQKALLRRYRVASRQVIAVIAKHSPIFEKASIDEAYMDVTEEAIRRLDSNISDGMNYGRTVVVGIESSVFPVTRQEKLLCIGSEIAQEIRDDIFKTLHFTTSVGIATNKLLSKLGSPLHKPDGQTLIPPRNVQEFMQSFPVNKIKGLGGKLGVKIVGISSKENKETDHVTAGEIVDEFGLPGLQQHLGVENGLHVYKLCCGDDNNEPVNTKKVLTVHVNSVKTFERTGHVTSVSKIHYWLRILCEEMVARFQEEEEENQRIATQLSVHFERPGLPKQYRNFGVPSKITVDSFYQATLAQIENTTVVPCSLVYLTAKDFVPLEQHANAKITHFFSSKPQLEHGKEMNDSMACNEVREVVTAASKFQPPNQPTTKRKAMPSIASFFTKKDHTTGFYCSKCSSYVDTSEEQHEDYHLALELSSQLNETSSNTIQSSAKRPKQGPMDFFMKRQ